MIRDKIKMCFSRALRWRKTWLVVTTLCFVWLFGGFVLLPYSLKYFLEKKWPEQTARAVSVGAIQFNPWRWALTVEKFSIADSDGSQLVSFDYLLLDYDMTSLFRLEVGLDALEWTKPYVKLAIDQSGSLGIQALAPPAKAQPKDAAPTVIPPVWVNRITIQDLIVDYRDSHREKPVELRLEPVSFSVADFHTRDVKHNNLMELQAHVAGDGQLAWEGQVRLEPLRVDGKLVMKDISLLPVMDFVPTNFQFVLQSARLDAELPHHVEMNGQLSASVQQARIGLRDIRIGAEPQSESLVSLPSIVVDGIDVDVQKQSVDVRSVQLLDGKIHVVQDASGNLNLQQLFSPKPVVATVNAAADPALPVATEPSQQSEGAALQPVAGQTAASQSAAPPSVAQPSVATQPAVKQPWQVAIAEIALDNYGVTVTDQKMSPAVEIALTPISIHAAGIKPLTADPIAIQVVVGMPNASELSIQGAVVASPLKLDADVTLKQLPLSLAQPYVAQQAKVVIGDGTLDASLKVNVSQQDTMHVAVSGGSAIRDLDVHESNSKRKVVSWRALELAGMDYSLAGNALTIAGITVDKPYGRFIINADGTTNIQQLLVQQTESRPAHASSGPIAEHKVAGEKPSYPPFALAVKNVTVKDGDMGFSDMTLKPNFRVAIEKLHGTINAISTDPAVMAKVDLSGKVDRYAPASIKGTFNVLGKTPVLDMAVAFKNIDLTTFTPYSGTYAGFAIDKGQLSVDLDYKLVNNRIAGKNRIVMNQLQLGEHVENTKAMDLPIRLALALLRDENGVIDLGFEVNGNVDEPSFSIGGLLLKVLGNVVMKAVTAPFSLFSGMMSAPEQSDKVSFSYGSAGLDELGESKVTAVATLLQKRAMIHVNVRGNVLPEEDRFALQQQRLATEMSKDSGLPAEQFLSPAVAVEAGSPRRLVGRQLHTLRNEELTDLEDRIREDMRAKQQAEDKTAVKVAAYEQAWRRLAEAVPLTEADLKQLAMARASQVKTALIEKHGVPPERIFVLDAANGDSAPEAVATLTLDAH